MKFTVYPSAQIKLAAAREDLRACWVAVAAGIVGTLAFALLVGKCNEVVLRAVMLGNALICAATGLFYACFLVVLARRVKQLESEVRHE